MAASSREMSAQTERMKGYVQELTVMVRRGGSNGNEFGLANDEKEAVKLAGGTRDVKLLSEAKTQDPLGDGKADNVS